MATPKTLPETSLEAPENGWLESMNLHEFWWKSSGNTWRLDLFRFGSRKKENDTGDHWNPGEEKKKNLTAETTVG